MKDKKPDRDLYPKEDDYTEPIKPPTSMIEPVLNNSSSSSLFKFDVENEAKVVLNDKDRWMRNVRNINGKGFRADNHIDIFKL